MKTALDRLKPSQFKPEEIEKLEKILDDTPCLVGRENFRLPLPDPIFHLLLQVVKSLRNGESVFLMPEDEIVSTKAAAEFLGVSRPFLIQLIESGKLPHYKVGTHRRIKMGDLVAYRKKRDEERRAGLKNVFDAIDEAGHYEEAG